MVDNIWTSRYITILIIHDNIPTLYKSISCILLITQSCHARRCVTRYCLFKVRVYVTQAICRKLDGATWWFIANCPYWSQLDLLGPADVLGCSWRQMMRSTWSNGDCFISHFLHILWKQVYTSGLFLHSCFNSRDINVWMYNQHFWHRGLNICRLMQNFMKMSGSPLFMKKLTPAT